MDSTTDHTILGRMNRIEHSVGTVNSEGRRLLEEVEGRVFRFEPSKCLQDGTPITWIAWLVEYENVRPLSGQDLNEYGEQTGD